MATESIGTLIPTAIPGYEDAADIQAALRAYHYGSYSYDAANTSPASLVTPSIAKTLYDLQVSSSSAVTLDGIQTLTNKTLTSPSISGLLISDSSITIEGATTNTFKTTLTVVDPTQNNTITFPNTGGNVVLDTASQTLTNKTLTTPTLTLSTTSSTTEGRVAWDETNEKLLIGDGTTAREFASSTLIFNAQTGTTYTLALADKDKLVILNNSSSISLTVPDNSSISYPIGSQINILQSGSGQVTVAGTSGVIVNGTPGLNFRSQWSSATLVKLDTDSWVLIGDLSE